MKGEVQVGEKEREHDTAAVRREIATLVAEKCVDPATQAPYSVSIIEKAMAEAGYSVRANKNAKSQVCSFPLTPFLSSMCMIILTHGVFRVPRCPSVSKHFNRTRRFQFNVPKCGFGSSSLPLILMYYVKDSLMAWTSSSTKIKERSGQGLVDSLFPFNRDLRLSHRRC